MSDAPGALGYQILQPKDDPDTKVSIMLWQDEASFRAMLASPESKAAHAGMSPDMWREAPSLQYFEGEKAWHPPTLQA
jgi:heme-degrading monooxygenase HmoA